LQKKKKEKTQKEILNNFLIDGLLSPRFNQQDRVMVAKMMQDQYKQGFLNGYSLNKK